MSPGQVNSFNFICPQHWLDPFGSSEFRWFLLLSVSAGYSQLRVMLEPKRLRSESPSRLPVYMPDCFVRATYQYYSLTGRKNPHLVTRALAVENVYYVSKALRDSSSRYQSYSVESERGLG